MQPRNDIQALLKKEGFIAREDYITEADLLAALGAALQQLLDRDAEGFFQLMYRLDVPEGALGVALGQGDGAALALVVYQRQLAKLKARQDNSRPVADDDELAW